MAEFTIIIPVYNAEVYVAKCLNSVVQQSFKDFNVVIVDDGSKDNSGKIIDAYASKYNNFMVIHQDNQGVSVARNVGIKNSDSEYICFLDADDYIENNFLELFHNEIIKSRPDLIISGVTVISDRKTNRILFHENEINIIRKKLLLDEWPLWVCNKCFRRDAFKEFAFIPGKIFEDMYFIGGVLKEAKVIKCIKEATYFYNCCNLNSITHNKTASHEYKFIEAKLFIRQKALNNGMSDISSLDSTIINLMRNCLLLDLVDGSLDDDKRVFLKEYLKSKNRFIVDFKDRFWVNRLLRDNHFLCRLYAKYRFRKL